MDAPDTPTSEQRVQQVRELLDRERLGLARQILQDALAHEPDHVGLLFEAARAEAIGRDPEAARSTLGRVLALEPGHWPARMLLIWLLIDAGELVDAEALALAMLVEEPQSASLYAAYARVMFKALKLDKARALCQEALRLEPDNDTALRTMALCDLVERPDATDSESLRRLLAQHPDDQHALSLVVVALSQAGRNREALRGARELLRMQPDEPQWVDNVRRLNHATHWTMWPLWPLQRFGWSASVALWAGGVLAVKAAQASGVSWVAPLAWVIVGYAVYSWVWPPLLRRLHGIRD